MMSTSTQVALTHSVQLAQSFLAGHGCEPSPGGCDREAKGERSVEKMTVRDSDSE